MLTKEEQTDVLIPDTFQQTSIDKYQGSLHLSGALANKHLSRQQNSANLDITVTSRILVLLWMTCNHHHLCPDSSSLMEIISSLDTYQSFRPDTDWPFLNVTKTRPGSCLCASQASPGRRMSVGEKNQLWALHPVPGPEPSLHSFTIQGGNKMSGKGFKVSWSTLCSGHPGTRLGEV